MIRSKPATMTLVRSIGEPVRLSAEMVLTVVGVQGRQVRLKLSAPQGALVGAPVLVNAVVGLSMIHTTSVSEMQAFVPIFFIPTIVAAFTGRILGR